MKHIIVHDSSNNRVKINLKDIVLTLPRGSGTHIELKKGRCFATESYSEVSSRIKSASYNID